MFTTLTRVAWLLALALALAGCAVPTSTRETKETDDKDADAACPHCAAARSDKAGDEDGCCCCGEAEKAGPDVTLKAVKLDELGGLIASHKGKVVVVDLWASSCPPCLKDFPR